MPHPTLHKPREELAVDGVMIAHDSAIFAPREAAVQEKRCSPGRTRPAFLPAARLACRSARSRSQTPGVHRRDLDQRPTWHHYGCGTKSQASSGLHHGNCKTLTFLGALRHDRLTGAINGQCFRAYVEQQLVPVLEPGGVLIKDKSAAIRQMIKAPAPGRICRLIGDLNPSSRPLPGSSGDAPGSGARPWADMRRPRLLNPAQRCRKPLRQCRKCFSPNLKGSTRADRVSETPSRLNSSCKRR